MKTILSKLPLVALCAAGVAMGSCSKEVIVENPEERNEIGVPPASARLVGRITEEVLQDDGSASATYTTLFEYDSQRRLVGAKRTSVPAGGSSEDLRLGYSGDILLITNNLSYGSGNYTLVDYAGYFEQGEHLVRGDYGFTSVRPSGVSRSTMLWTGAYDDNGYMTSCGWDGAQNDISWSGGNMTRLAPAGGGAVDTFGYGALENDPMCNLDLNFVGGSTGFVGLYAALPGFFGNRCRNLRTVQTIEDPENPEDAQSYVFEYRTDGQGFVEAITQVRVRAAGSQTTIYTIEYR